MIRGDNHELWSSARDACGVTDSVRPDIRRMVSARMERRRNKRMHTVNWDLYPRVGAHPVTRGFIAAYAWASAPKTIDAYARNLDDLLRFFDDASLERVIAADRNDLHAYVHALRTRPAATTSALALRASRAGGELLSAATIRQRVVTARLFYAYLIEGGHRHDTINPVRRGRQGVNGERPVRGTLVSHGTRLPWIPSDEEWERLVRHVSAHEPLRDLCLILLAYDGALRRQELVHVRLDDIAWGPGLITVRAALSKTGLQRTVTFSAATATVLRRYLVDERAPLLAACGGDPDGPLFLSVSNRNPGVPLRIGAFNDVIERIRATVGMPQLRTHTFRHLRCTVLRRCGIDYQDIALYAGHASVASTQIYVHLTPSMLAARIGAATAAQDARMQRLLQEVAYGRV